MPSLRARCGRCSEKGVFSVSRGQVCGAAGRRRLERIGDLAGWTSAWTDTGVLPESIALEIEFVDDVYIQWPLLTAAVRVDPAALSGLLTDSEGGNRNYSSAIQDMINRRRGRRGDSE